MPTVAIKLQLKNVSSLNRTKRQVLPTPESPMSIIYLNLCSKKNKEEFTLERERERERESGI
jgi:hypothetical protein